MSQNVGEIDLSLILNSDKFSSQLKNIEGQANQASSKISGALKGIGKAALAAFSIAAITKFGKACVDVATETSNAWIGLNSILTGQGKSFSQAQKFIQDYVSDGLVPLNNAVGAYKNLALRGYSSDQIQKTMTALKNSATFARQSTYSLGDAVQTATEGLKNENSVVVDNAGVTKNVAKMWEDYAKSIGKTTNQLTQAEKIEAEVNGILEETKFQSNDAAIYANTYAGKLAQLNSAFTNMKVAIGNVIQPIAKLFIPMITAAANAVTKLFTAIAGLMSMFGLKADSVETVSKGLGGMADSADKASDAVKGVGDNASKTAKKAKKAAQQLAGFDEMNKLSEPSDSSSGSGSGGAGGGASALADALDVTTNIQQDTSAFDGMLDKVKELASIFKEGFNISFGDTNFDGIIGHLQGIKESIIDIWTDPDVLNSAGQWVDTMLFSLGQAVGAVARIGVNIVEGLLGSIDKYLSQNIDRIKTHICNMFDISSEDMALTGNLWQALGEISDVFSGDTAKQIGANIIAMFANPFMSLQEFCAKFVKDIKGVLFQPIIDNAEKIKTTFENVLEPIKTVTGTLAEAMTYVGDKWNEVYDTYISPFMESLKTGLSDTFSKFLDVYNEYVVPFLDNVANGINTLWTEHLKPLVDKIGELIGSIVNALKVLWEKWLKPIVDWVIQNVLPKLVPVFEGLWNTIKNIFGHIADAIGGIIDFFKGLIDFIVGVFTGDWNKAWEGIKTAFSGIWNAIKGIVQAVWEAIKGIVTNTINIIKTVISTVFSAIQTIITNIWNGIKTFITNIWNGIKDMISNVINGIKNTVTNVFNSIKTSITNIWNNIVTTITNVWNTIKTRVKEGAQGAWNAITGIFSGIANWFKNIFTQAWTNVKNVFSTGGKIFDGIKEGIVNFFKTIVNGIISGINKVIAVPFNAINNILQKIHDIDILGVKPFTWVHKFSVPEIPKLAQGGYVEANTPRLAVVGDNRTQGEIISPVDKMRETFLSALQEFKNMNTGLGGDYVPIEINIPISLDGEEIQRLQDERKARLALATNGRRY
ncbi:MAG: hypothetical protein IJV31_02695 [Clostridia bacterium]|nr:hypothetical protein [Clostridia bacterium]